MPKTAWRRQLRRIQDQLADWSDAYAHHGQTVPVVYLSERAFERAYKLDALWHELERSVRVLDQPW